MVVLPKVRIRDGRNIDIQQHLPIFRLGLEDVATEGHKVVQARQHLFECIKFPITHNDRLVLADIIEEKYHGRLHSREEEIAHVRENIEKGVYRIV